MLSNCLTIIVIVKLFLITTVLLINLNSTLQILVRLRLTFSDSSFDNYMSRDIVSEPFTFSIVSSESLETIVGSLKNSLPDHDEIPISILKEFLHLLCSVMMKICKKSLQQGIFPNSLKKAKTIPIFKAGDRKKY